MNVSIQIVNDHLFFLLGYLTKLTITTDKKRRRRINECDLRSCFEYL